MADPVAIPLEPAYAVSRMMGQSVAAFVNVYAEQAPGKQTFHAMGYPGEVLVSQGAAKVRGIYKDERPGGLVYAVVGTSFGTLDANGTLTSIGTVDGDDLIEWEANANQIGIVGGGKLYVLDVATAYFAQVTQTASGDVLPGISSIAMVNSTGLLATEDSDTWYYTDLDDFRTIRSLSSARAESRPDPLIAVRVIKGEPWFFGTRTIEPYSNTGEANFPFSRRPVNDDYGAVARDTIRNFDNSVMMLAKDAYAGGLAVVRAQGYQMVRVTGHAIEKLLEKCAHPERARAITWAIEGHKFYTLITEEGSVTYDAATQMWHMTASGNWSHGAAPPPSVWTCQAWVDNANWYGDLSGRITRASFDAVDSAGTPLIWEVVTPYTGAIGRRVTTYALEADLEVGFGTATSASQITMQKISDGRYTLSAPRARSWGEQGKWKTRARWSRLGTSLDAAFRLRVEGARLKLVQLWAEPETTRRG